jgi:hypothetical protein
VSKLTTGVGRTIDPTVIIGVFQHHLHHRFVKLRTVSIFYLHPRNRYLGNISSRIELLTLFIGALRGLYLDGESGCRKLVCAQGHPTYSSTHSSYHWEGQS